MKERLPLLINVVELPVATLPTLMLPPPSSPNYLAAQVINNKRIKVKLS